MSTFEQDHPKLVAEHRAGMSAYEIEQAMIERTTNRPLTDAEARAMFAAIDEARAMENGS